MSKRNKISNQLSMIKISLKKRLMSTLMIKISLPNSWKNLKIMNLIKFNQFKK